jgi:hypothetical protein
VAATEASMHIDEHLFVHEQMKLRLCGICVIR